MQTRLSGVRVAILATDGVEQSELLEPKQALEQAGAETKVVSPAKARTIQGMNHSEKGEKIPVDLPLEQSNPDDFDALLLPGGVANPDRLRMDAKAVRFVRSFVESGKPIGAICHGPWTLIEAGGVRGRRMTSWPSLQTDLRNAGADWVDQECVVDQGLITSRKPDDLPAFNRKIVEEFAEGRHAKAGHNGGARGARR